MDFSCTYQKCTFCTRPKFFSIPRYNLDEKSYIHLSYLGKCDKNSVTRRWNKKLTKFFEQLPQKAASLATAVNTQKVPFFKSAQIFWTIFITSLLSLRTFKIRPILLQWTQKSFLDLQKIYGTKLRRENANGTFPMILPRIWNKALFQFKKD